MGQRRLAIIPARSGSKGVPDKNLQVVAGETLLERAVRTARLSGLFDRVYVSTDSERYAEAALAAGAPVPFLRPAALAGDQSLVADAIKFTLETFAERGETFDTLALLEPSSPLRTAEIVRQVTLAAEAEGWDAAFTASPVPLHLHPRKHFSVDPDGRACFYLADAKPNINRQELAPTYVRNGLCYAVRCDAFLAAHSIHGFRAKAIIAPGPAISIDTEEDLREVRALLEGAPAMKEEATP